MHRTLFGLVIVLLFSLGFGAAAHAQAKAPNSAQMKAAAHVAKQAAANEADLRDLIKTLESDPARQKLIAQLNALLAAKKSIAPKTPEKPLGTRILDLVSQRIDDISAEFIAGSRAIMDVPNLYDWAVQQLSDDTRRAKWLEISWKIALALVIGLVGEWLVRLLLARPRKTLESRQTDYPTVKVISLLGRTVLDVLPIAGFLGASYAALALVVPGALWLRRRPA